MRQRGKDPGQRRVADRPTVLSGGGHLAVGQLERRVLDETLPVHLEREREDLQIARERVRAEHTCNHPPNRQRPETVHIPTPPAPSHCPTLRAKKNKTPNLSRVDMAPHTSTPPGAAAHRRGIVEGQTCDVTRGLGLEVAHGPGGGFLPELLHHHCRLLHLKLDLVDSVILLVGLDGAALKLGLLLAFECARLLDLSSGHARISGLPETKRAGVSNRKQGVRRETGALAPVSPCLHESDI